MTIDPVLAEPAHPRAAFRMRWAVGVGAAAVALLLLGGWMVGRWPLTGDRALILALHGAGPPWLRAAMVDVTALGSGTVLTAVTIAATGLLLMRRLWLPAALTLAGCWSGSLVVTLTKQLFARARPDIVEPLVEIGGMSFPSGHAANSAVIYLTAAALATQVMRGRGVRRYVLAVALLLVGVIGTSRVYLGVHWPSDVLAGWSFGALWALAWWLAGARARASTAG